jgi:two-component system, NarL family, nitrate/nitrite response regulator NarL
MRRNVNRKTDSTAHMPAVLIASAEVGLRRNWARALRETCRIQEAAGRVEVECVMSESCPAALLLDLDLPEIEDLTGISAVQNLSPSTKIILFAGVPERDEEIAALKTGAKGYCKKEIEPSLLKKMVTVILKDEIWAGRKIIAALLEQLRAAGNGHNHNGAALHEVYLDSLTPRQRETALLVGEGACNKEIAGQLSISERTVKAHLTSIFQKLQISDRLQLGLFISGNGNNRHSGSGNGNNHPKLFPDPQKDYA